MKLLSSLPITLFFDQRTSFGQSKQKEVHECNSFGVDVFEFLLLSGIDNKDFLILFSKRRSR
jgi:hypothetical protein